MVGYGPRSRRRGSRQALWRRIGAVLLLVSLIYKPNPASILIEFAWFGISVIGLIRALRARQRAKQENSSATSS